MKMIENQENHITDLNRFSVEQISRVTIVTNSMWRLIRLIDYRYSLNVESIILTLCSQIDEN